MFRISKSRRSLSGRSAIGRSVMVLVSLIIAMGGHNAWGALTSTALDWTTVFDAYDQDMNPVTYAGFSGRDYETNQGTTDPTNGGTNVNPAEVDLSSGAGTKVQTGEEYTAFWSYYDGAGTSDYLFFRVRINANPSSAAGFSAYHWNVLLDTDGDGYKEFWLDLYGGAGNGNDAVQVLYEDLPSQMTSDRRTVTSVIIEDFLACNLLNTTPDAPYTSSNSHTRLVNIGDGTGEYYIDFQIPLSALRDKKTSGTQKVFLNQPLLVLVSTSASLTDPLQKDWLGPYFDQDCRDCTFNDPAGTVAFSRFDSNNRYLIDTDYYWELENVYLMVRDEGKNTNTTDADFVTVTVTSPSPKSDSEVVTLYETGPNTGVFANTGGVSDFTYNSAEGWMNEFFTTASTAAACWSIVYNQASGQWRVSYQVDCTGTWTQDGVATPNSLYTSTWGGIKFIMNAGTPADGNSITFETYPSDLLETIASANATGKLYCSDGDTITVTYLDSSSTQRTDTAIIKGVEIEFTTSTGRILTTPADGGQDLPYRLIDETSGDLIYVTVWDRSRNVDTGAPENIVVTLTTPSGDPAPNDTYLSFQLTETGANTGVFRNTAGLQSSYDQDGTPDSATLWEDANGGIIQARYDYYATPITDTWNFRYSAFGVVYFKDISGENDVLTYEPNDYIYILVDDANGDGSVDTAAIDNVTVSITTTTGESELVTCYETGLNTGLYMNKFKYGTWKTTVFTADDSPKHVYDGNFPTDITANVDRLIHYNSDWTIYREDLITARVSSVQLTMTTSEGGNGLTDVYFTEKKLITTTVSPDGVVSSADVNMECFEEATTSITVAYNDLSDGDAISTNNMKYDYAGYDDGTTDVSVSSFSVYSLNGQSVVEWRTDFEAGTLGFNLWRWNEAKAKYDKVNQRMLPGLLTSPQGGIYRYVDQGASSGGTYRYYLQEVEVGNSRRWYGPYEVTVGTRPSDVALLDQGEVANYQKKAHQPSEEAMARMAVRKEVRKAAKAERLKKKGLMVKAGVKEDGMVMVSASQLASLIQVGNENAQETVVRNMIKNKGFRVTSVGRDVACAGLDDGSGLLFYGQAVDSIYSDANVYWISRRTGAPLIMASQKGGQGPKSGQVNLLATYPESVHLEQDVSDVPHLFSTEETDFWVWSWILAGYPGWDRMTTTVKLDHVNPSGQATMIVNLRGTLDAPKVKDNHAIVTLNGTEVGSMIWDGMQYVQIVCQIPRGCLVNGVNTICIRGVLDKGVSGSIQLLDSIDLTYDRYYYATDQDLVAPANGNSILTISGFDSSDITVFDVTDPLLPSVMTRTLVESASDGYRVTFYASPTGVYEATSFSGYHDPAWCIADEASTLASTANAAQYVIITTDDLEASAQRLSTYRSAQGLSAMVVDLEDIYDEFNYGFVDPQAIKAFLAYAASSWTVAPSYVLLAGHGTYDYKNVYKLNDNLIPVYMRSTPNGLWASDTFLADVVNWDGVPDVAIGRLPVATSQELDSMIDKIMAYEWSSGDWTDKILLLADNADQAGDFPADSDTLAALLHDYRLQKIYLSTLKPAQARTMLLSGLADGAVLFNYIGHGGADKLAVEGLLTKSDVPKLSNASHLPVFLGWTCSVGNFANPRYDSLAEDLVMSTAGGVVAAFSPTGLSYDEEALLMSQGLFRDFAAGERMLGALSLSAAYSHAAKGSSPFMEDIYNVMGDPALKLK